MLIDLHAHTYPISWDSALSPKQLIALCKNAGVDGVCLTEHDYFWDVDECAALAKEEDFLVLPAIEVNTEYGHILAYGLKQYKFGMHRVEQLGEMVEADGGVMIAAHPYRRYMPWYELKGPDLERNLEKAMANKAYAHCVALETLHGRAAPEQNAFSRMLCERLGMHATGGSDAHQPDHVGRCVTSFERQIASLEDLVAELRAGRYQPVELHPRQVRIPSV